MSSSSSSSSSSLSLYLGLIATSLLTICSRRRKKKTTKNVSYRCREDEDFLDWGKEMLKWIVKYRSRHIDENPVQSSVKPNFLISALPEDAPLSPEQSFFPIMKDLTEKVLPGLTGWESSKHFFAYFKPHASYPAVIGELLCAGVNQMGFDWVASPACTELEMVTLDWLAKFLNLPEKFLMSNKSSPGGGVIQGSAGESATVVLLAAIAKTKKRLGVKNLERGKCVVYV